MKLFDRIIGSELSEFGVDLDICLIVLILSCLCKT